VSYVGAAPKRGLCISAITPNGKEHFQWLACHTSLSVGEDRDRRHLRNACAAARQTAGRFEGLGGRGGSAGVRQADEALYVGGPIWSIQITGPEWVELRIPAVR